VKKLLLVALAIALALPAIIVSAAVPETTAVHSGASFILANFSSDGAFSGGSPGANMDAIYALRAAGFDPSKDVTAAGKSPVTYLEANAASLTKPADAAKAALAATALGLNPTSVSGTNLLAAINTGFDPAHGTYAADDFSQSIAMLGLACSGASASVPAAAVTELRSTQLPDGGWGFGGTSDPDTTAIATQALLAAGVPTTDAAIGNAIGWFKSNQLADGGWGFAPSSNTNSTAYVVQALIAAGQDSSGPQYTHAGVSPLSYLLSQQNADGSFNGFDALVATVQVVPALAGRTFCNAPTTPITQSAPTGPLPTKPTATPTASPPPSTTPASTTTPTPAASPTPASTTSPTARATAPSAPQPPATGSGSESSQPALPIVLAALILLVASVTASFVSRKR